MKTKILALFLTGILLLGVVGQANAAISVSFNLFYNNLSAYGNWVDVPQYGEVWYPNESYTESNWQPYLNGQWTWTDAGWTWVSSEPWGWATYHYGHWAYTDEYGWVWIPGTVWAPAWVSWYVGPNYIGWSPLPDEGESFSPQYCVFVQSRFFLAANIRDYAAPVEQNYTIINSTRNITSIRAAINNRVNPGPSISLIQKATGMQVQRVKLVDRQIQNPNPARFATESKPQGVARVENRQPARPVAQYQSLPISRTQYQPANNRPQYQPQSINMPQYGRENSRQGYQQPMSRAQYQPHQSGRSNQRR